MNPRRISLLLLAAAIVVGGSATGRWFSGRVTAPVREAPVAVTAVGAASSVARVSEAAPMEIGRGSPRMVRVPPAPQTLPADASALIAEVADLQLAAQGSDLELDPQQWQALASVTLETQAIRHAYEATVATAAVLAPGRYRVEVPVYAAAGDALRARLHQELRERLGETCAAEIQARLGGRLEGRFGGFGVSAQTLEIAGEPGAAHSGWQLTRTVKFWNSIEGQDRLTTRRETFLSGQDELTGETWSPLLALLAERLKATTGS